MVMSRCRFVALSAGVFLLMTGPMRLLPASQPTEPRVAGETVRQTAPRQSPDQEDDLKSIKRVVRVGAWLESGARGASDVQLALPVPTDWPEQHVNMFEETIPNEVLRSDYQQSETVRRLIANIPKIKAGQLVELQVMFEVTVQEVPFPDRTDHLVKPDRPPREIRLYLGPGEMIESRKATVRRQAEAVVAGHEFPWDQARAIYDWVTNHIEIDKEMTERGAVEAIKNLKGSREDPSYAFVALCRSQKIPARMVWADGGEYAEFYLQDDTGAGRWYPAVLEGKPEFGKMTNPRVIFQKGDNIRIPESSQRKLFVTESVRGTGKLKSVRWMRDILPARDSR